MFKNAKMKTYFRKHWLRLLVYGGLGCCLVDGFLIEPHWIKVDRISLADHPTVRVVHISDIHFKGDSSYLRTIVEKVNKLDPDIVCFTGDIVEDTRYLPTPSRKCSWSGGMNMLLAA